MWEKMEYKHWEKVTEYCAFVDCNDTTVNPLLLFMWRHVNNLEILIEEKWILLKGRYDYKDFVFRPLCKNKDVVEAFHRIDELITGEVTLAHCHKSLLRILNEGFKPIKVLKEDYPEYIYKSSQFLTFAGRSMQKKRNQLNNFIKRHRDNNVEVKHIKDVDHKKLYKYMLWWKEKYEKPSDFFEEESVETLLIIKHYDLHKSNGTVVLIDGVIKAFSVVTTGCDFGVYNIEKADSSIKGLYQFLQKSTANMFWNKPGIKWISREDSAGDVNLAKSKESYHPVFLSKRSTVTWR